MTWPLNQNPVSDLRYDEFPSSEQNVWRAFIDFLFDNDEKMASSLTALTHIKTRVQKPYPIYDQNG